MYATNNTSITKKIQNKIAKTKVLQEISESLKDKDLNTLVNDCETVSKTIEALGNKVFATELTPFPCYKPPDFYDSFLSEEQCTSQDLRNHTEEKIHEDFITIVNLVKALPGEIQECKEAVENLEKQIESHKLISKWESYELSTAIHKEKNRLDFKEKSLEYIRLKS